jgi:O-antigen/teichoic acid export membrane protein
VADPPPREPPSASEEAGARAAKNTLARASAEVIGKVATFAVFAVLARSVSESAVGAFVFALAFLQIAMYLVGLGCDSYMLRQVATDRSSVHRLFFNVVVLKLVVAGPVIAFAFVVLHFLGVDATTRDTVIALTPGVLFDTMLKSPQAVFDAHERGPLTGTSLVVQRLVTATLAIGAMATGYGVVTVAAIYSFGAAVGFAAACLLLARGIGFPRRSLDVHSWRRLARSSLAFGLQDVFGVLLFRLDAVLLAALATPAAVGRYGAAYRLLESTLFVSWALNGAFAAMFAYLGRDTDPTVSAVFERALKVAIVVLMPVAVALVVFSEPIMRLAFGADFGVAAPALRLLGPVVVLIAIVTICTSLIFFRGDPRTIVRITAAMVTLNVILNVALIPRYDEAGAAAAMLITEAVFCIVVLRMCAGEVGGISWRGLFAAPGAAGAAMTAVAVALSSIPLAAIAVGTVAYLAAYLAVERVVCPDDLAFLRTLLRRMLRRRVALSES